MSGLIEAGFILFLVIATCDDEGIHSFAWTMWIICAVLAMTAWMMGVEW